MEPSQSPEIDKLTDALVQSQLALEPVKKDCVNPFFHSKYADLASVWKALTPFLLNGIAITQSPVDSPDGYIVLDTQLTHTSGQWMRSRLKMRLGKDDPQGAGSALTYARRYALGCMTGLVTEEDDDGNTASKPATKVSQIDAAAPRGGQRSQVRELLPKTEPELANHVKSCAPVAKWVVPFGKMKGQPISDIGDDDVDYLLRYYNAKLNDAANLTSRYRDEWEQAILEIRAEQLARFPDPVIR